MVAKKVQQVEDATRDLMATEDRMHARWNCEGCPWPASRHSYSIDELKGHFADR